MDKKHWIIFTVVVLAIFGGIIWLGKNKAQDFKGDPARIIVDGPIQDRVFGSRDQKVVLVEYGDFQCPACKSFWPVVDQLKSKYQDKLTFIFRQLPLTTIHPNALAAATSAEAVGQQGKFFEMYDLLYQNQSAWQSLSVGDRTSAFEEYAAKLGIDMDKYKQDLGSADVVGKIDRDHTTAELYGADQTPTFVLNGKKLVGDQTTPQGLTPVVEAEIAKFYSNK